ncbi:hypothetical protein FGG08_002131 [Glutinoglossum americanum]|uniref:DUF7514 domain-containing protein n=1 Tax=Glutinoglossum americanum TaxID=1670608 RepID=A0A9P8I0R4_9PEZI|nr:hypothetical protein FGG08_002131 [Glutinoglossum americanum]
MSAAQEDPVGYWGHMIRPNRGPSDLFDFLLRGIANYVIDNIDPKQVNHLTPEKLAAFYKSVGGNYDELFLETPNSSLSFLYQALGCAHSFEQPVLEHFSPPSIPALAHAGFVRWQTIQLLLDPNEQVPFLQEAVRKFDILHPATGGIFPKVLPREAFPEQPDEEMTRWYNSVAEKLEREAQSEQEGSQTEQPPREHTRDVPRQRQRRDISPPRRPAAGSAEMPDEANYFRTHHDNFHNRNDRDNVIYVTPPVSPYQYGNMRNRRRSFPEEIYNQGLRRSPDSSLHSHHHDSARRRKSHSPMRRNSIDSSSGSESDTESITDSESPTGPRVRRDNQLSPPPQQTRFAPVLVHRRSRDLPGLHERYDPGARGRGDYSYETYHHSAVPSQRDGYLHHEPTVRGNYRGQNVKWNGSSSIYHAAPGRATGSTASTIGRRISPDRPVDMEWGRGGRQGFRRILPHLKGMEGRRYPPSSYY